jgi:TolB-like protein
MDQKKPAVFAVTASLVALAVAISWTLRKGKLLPQNAGTTKGVAVLPFENLSPDPDNAYFAEGIHEEILTRLATIHDLKIILRNSTRRNLILS